METPAEPVDLTSVHIDRATAGDPESTAWIVGRFGPLLAAQARYRLKGLEHVAHSEDVVQEVWMITLSRLPDLRARNGRWTPVVLRFLSTTLMRRIHHHLRRRIGEGSRREELGSEELAARTSGILTCVHRTEVFGAVHEAIEKLPPEEREVLVLRGIEQLSNGEIARKLAVPDYTVTRRYQRALLALREAVPSSIFDELR